MALYELGKAHFAINSDGTFRYLGRLIKKDWYNISSKQWTFKYQFSKNDGITTDTVVVNYIPGTSKELEPKVIYTAEEKVAYEKEKRGIKGMAKFKVGDRVKLNPFKFTEFHDKIGTIKLIWIDKFGNYSYNVDFKDTNLMVNNVEEKWLELVEPKEDTIKKAFERPSFSTEPLEKLDIPLPHELQMNHRVISGLMTKTIPVMEGTLELVEEIMNYGKPKNRIPDRVVFNQDKGKVTVLISKHLDGVAPYWAYTSKVHGDDEYNGYFGFFLSYYKYLNRHLGGDTRKELIDMAFQHGDKAEFIIEGAVTQEVLKLIKIDEWKEILHAIFETSSQNKGYWDYLEWKEMLRVHELETKREEQKAIRKEIKKHEQEIEKLKKKGV